MGNLQRALAMYAQMIIKPTEYSALEWLALELWLRSAIEADVRSGKLVGDAIVFCHDRLTDAETMRMDAELRELDQLTQTQFRSLENDNVLYN